MTKTILFCLLLLSLVWECGIREVVPSFLGDVKLLLKFLLPSFLSFLVFFWALCKILALGAIIDRAGYLVENRRRRRQRESEAVRLMRRFVRVLGARRRIDPELFLLLVPLLTMDRRSAGRWLRDLTREGIEPNPGPPLGPRPVRSRVFRAAVGAALLVSPVFVFFSYAYWATLNEIYEPLEPVVPPYLYWDELFGPGNPAPALAPLWAIAADPRHSFERAFNLTTWAAVRYTISTYLTPRPLQGLASANVGGPARHRIVSCWCRLYSVLYPMARLAGYWVRRGLSKVARVVAKGCAAAVVAVVAAGPSVWEWALVELHRLAYSCRLLTYWFPRFFSSHFGVTGMTSTLTVPHLRNVPLADFWLDLSFNLGPNGVPVYTMSLLRQTLDEQIAEARRSWVARAGIPNNFWNEHGTVPIYTNVDLFRLDFLSVVASVLQDIVLAQTPVGGPHFLPARPRIFRFVVEQPLGVYSYEDKSKDFVMVPPVAFPGVVAAPVGAARIAQARGYSLAVGSIETDDVFFSVYSRHTQIPGNPAGIGPVHIQRAAVSGVLYVFSGSRKGTYQSPFSARLLPFNPTVDVRWFREGARCNLSYRSVEPEGVSIYMGADVFTQGLNPRALPYPSPVINLLATQIAASVTPLVQFNFDPRREPWRLAELLEEGGAVASYSLQGQINVMSRVRPALEAHYKALDDAAHEAVLFAGAPPNTPKATTNFDSYLGVADEVVRGVTLTVLSRCAYAMEGDRAVLQSAALLRK